MFLCPGDDQSVRLSVGDEALVAALGYFQPSLLEVIQFETIKILHYLFPGYREEKCGGDGQRRGG